MNTEMNTVESQGVISNFENLTEEQRKEIIEISKKIDLNNPISISYFGDEAFGKTPPLTERMLERIKASQNDEMTKNIKEIIKASEEASSVMNPEKKSLKNRIYESSLNLPVIGYFAKKAHTAREIEIDKHTNVSSQLQNVVDEVDKSIQYLSETNQMLEDIYNENIVRNRAAELYILAAQRKIDEHIKTTTDDEKNISTMTYLERQEQLTIKSSISILEKKILDQKAVQEHNYQFLSFIRIVQSNNMLLIEKGKTAKQLTIPTWKNGFVIRGALIQQQGYVNFMENIDATTTSLLSQNNALIYNNSVRTAEANQKLVISLKVLEEGRENVKNTLNRIIEIQEQGKKQNTNDIAKLEELRNTPIAQSNKLLR